MGGKDFLRHRHAHHDNTSSQGSLHGVLDRTPFAFQRFAGFAVWQQILSPHFALC
jgi:hypothetical protein